MRTPQRNWNPHQEARIALLLWSDRYMKQRGGVMDFWDSLPESDRKYCRDIAALIRKSAPENANDEAMKKDTPQ